MSCADCNDRVEEALLYSEGVQAVLLQGEPVPPQLLSLNLILSPQSGTAQPHGMIDLIECVTVKSAEHKAQKRNAFEVSLKGDHFMMYAMTDKEKDEWIGRIGKSIVKHSSMYMHDEQAKKEVEEEEDDEEDAEYPHA